MNKQTFEEKIREYNQTLKLRNNVDSIQDSLHYLDRENGFDNVKDTLSSFLENSFKLGFIDQNISDLFISTVNKAEEALVHGLDNYNVLLKKLKEEIIEYSTKNNLALECGIISFKGIKEDKVEKLVEFLELNAIPVEININSTEGSTKKNGDITIYGASEKDVIENTDKIQVYSLKSNIAGNIRNVILKDVDYLIETNKVGLNLNSLTQNKNKQVKKLRP